MLNFFLAKLTACSINSEFPNHLRICLKAEETFAEMAGCWTFRMLTDY
jgi:hypothetical protein